jgi:RHS repeat-associated protein
MHFGDIRTIKIALGSSPFIETYVAGMHLGTYYLNSTVTATSFYYAHSDWLGTERARTNLSGIACETIGSLPFGDGQTITGTCGDISHLHFTGKERDAESNLDQFGARYFASTMGRFMTPDWAAKPTTVPYGSFGDPQTLNLYTYVENAPVNRVDADGHFDLGISGIVGNINGILDDPVQQILEAMQTYTASQSGPAPDSTHHQTAQNRQPDGSYKATPAQLAKIKAADKNGTTITTKADSLGQCVTACESFTGVPGPTSSWREGTSATDLTDKDIGTAIATFQGSGDKARYKSDADGHKNSGVYMGRSVGGFWMADQWPGQKPVTIRFVPTTDHNNPDNASMNGSSYSVILVPNP